MSSDLALTARWWSDDYGLGWGCQQRRYESFWRPCYDPWYNQDFWAIEMWDLVSGVLQFLGYQVTQIMDHVDYTWTDLTTNFSEGGGTDGFIQYRSQVYPNVPGAFTPFRVLAGNQPSHVGETVSLQVLNAVREHLALMGINPKQ